MKSKEILPITLNQRGLIIILRSEEHTSELQSQSNLVCRLLLEKKKNTYVDRGPLFPPVRPSRADRFTWLFSCPGRIGPQPSPSVTGRLAARLALCLDHSLLTRS